MTTSYYRIVSTLAVIILSHDVRLYSVLPAESEP